MVKHRFGKKALSLLMAICLLASVFSLPTVVTAVTTDETTSAVTTNETASQAADYGLADNIQDGVILHCFNWKYNDIKAMLPEIAEAGFTSVQTSPAQPQVTSGKWYWLYQPLGFYVGTNDLGTKADLQALCDEAENYGVNVVVDVVANHLAGDHSNIQSDLKDSQYWHQESGGINYLNRWEIHQRAIGMPDINSEHSYVQQCVRKYVDELVSMGVDGIRWDAAKHISVPSENDNQFWPTVTNGTGIWSYGEILDDPVASDLEHGVDNTAYAAQLMKEYTNYISVTDSTYSGNIRKAFRDGYVSQSIGNYSERGVSKNKLVYWAESHDTYSNGGSGDGTSQYIDQNKIDRAYAIVASQNGASALYFSRPSSTDKESILAGQKGSTHFTSPEVAEVNKFHNAMVGQKEYYTTSNNCAAVCREQGAVIVAGSGSNMNVSIPNGGATTAPGTYTDQVSGNTWTVTATTISGQIGSSGIAVIYNAVTTPSVSVSKNSGTYRVSQADGISVDLSLRNATSGTYSINGGAAQTFTGDTTISVGEGVDYGVEITLTVTATDGTTTSDPQTYTYKKSDPSQAQMVYFDNSSYNWSQVYCYMYTDGGSTGGGGSSGGGSTGGGSTGGGSTGGGSSDGTIKFTDSLNWGNVNAYFFSGSSTVGAEWPGTAMTKYETNTFGQTVYEITIPSGATHVIFNNGNAQTVDLSLSGVEGYYLDGSQTEGKYNGTAWDSSALVSSSAMMPTDPVASSAASSDLVASGAENAAWPGVKMTLDSATGYYVTEVPEGMENALVIFTEGTSSTNRYPADMQPGLALNGNTMLFSAGNSWKEYTSVTPTQPTEAPTQAPTQAPTEAPTQAPTQAPTEPPTDPDRVTIIIGDVFEDGKISVADALVVQKYMLGLANLTAKQQAAADADADGRITNADAVEIQKYDLGIIVSGYVGRQQTITLS